MNNVGNKLQSQNRKNVITKISSPTVYHIAGNFLQENSKISLYNIMMCLCLSTENANVT